MEYIDFTAQRLHLHNNCKRAIVDLMKEAYFSFVQEGLITEPAQNEVIYKGEKYVFDGQDNIRTKTRYAMEQGLKGMMSWDLATDLPLDDSKSLLKAMVEELRK